MMLQNNHPAPSVSLPTLRLVLGLLALAISFYYSFKFISVGTTGFELLSALAFVCITEATKAMYSHDIAYYSATKQGDKTLFAALIVLILFALSITATVYFLLASPLKDDAKLQTSSNRTQQLQQQIATKQAQLAACNPNYLTKCVNPRTSELNALQAELSKASVNEESLSAIQANKAFWQKTAVFAGTDADSLQMYFAIIRGVLLEVIGLALIAQATSHRKLQNSFVESTPPITPKSLPSDDSKALLGEIERLKTELLEFKQLEKKD